MPLMRRFKLRRLLSGHLMKLFAEVLRTAVSHLPVLGLLHQATIEVAQQFKTFCFQGNLDLNWS